MTFWEYLKLARKHPLFVFKMGRGESRDALFNKLKIHDSDCGGCVR